MQRPKREKSISLGETFLKGGTLSNMRSASRPFDPDHMILLAPKVAASLANFNSIQVDPVRHKMLLGQAQRLRGSIYLQDGAIGPHQLRPDGRLVHSHDEQSWQFLIMNSADRVSGCIR